MSPCKISGNMHLSLWSRLRRGVGQVHKNENFKKMKRTALWIAAISCIMTMISCGTGKKALTSADIDGQWTIVEAMGQAVTGNEGNVPSINFNIAEKSVSGTTGCNSFMGGFTLGENNEVSFSPLAATKMMCRDMKAEMLIFQAAEAARTARKDNEDLVFCSEDGNVVLKMTR